MVYDKKIIEDIKLFSDQCIWVYETWLLYQTLCGYDYSKVPVMQRMGTILHEYTFLQIAKLFDPGEDKFRNKNLSIDYVVNHMAWQPKTKEYLCEIEKRMRDFGNKIKPARSKIITHPDLNTQRCNITHGAFDSGEDETFFNDLHELLDVVCKESMNEPFPDYPEFVKSDALLLLKSLGIDFADKQG